MFKVGDKVVIHSTLDRGEWNGWTGEIVSNTIGRIYPYAVKVDETGTLLLREDELSLLNGFAVGDLVVSRSGLGKIIRFNSVSGGIMLEFPDGNTIGWYRPDELKKINNKELWTWH